MAAAAAPAGGRPAAGLRPGRDAHCGWPLSRAAVSWRCRCANAQHMRCGTGDGRWMHTGFRQGAGSAALTVPRSAAGACHRHVGSHVDLHKSDCADEGDRSLLALLVPVFVLRPPLLSCVQLVLLSVLILALAFSWQGDPTPSAGSTVEPAALRIQWTGSGRWGAGCGVRVCARAQSLCLPLLLPPPFPVRSLTCTLSHSLLLIPLFSLSPPPPPSLLSSCRVSRMCARMHVSMYFPERLRERARALEERARSVCMCVRRARERAGVRARSLSLPPYLPFPPPSSKLCLSHTPSLTSLHHPPFPALPPFSLFSLLCVSRASVRMHVDIGAL